MRRFLCFSALSLFVLASVGSAQDVSAKISGTVLDVSGAGVPNAKVTVTNTDRNQVERTVTADNAGNYSAPLLPVGTYSVQVEARGFKSFERTGIVLNVNDDLSINIPMQVGALTDKVEVASTAAQVELGAPTSATTVEGTQVRELALNTRNYEQLVELMPGVAIKANPSDELFIGNSSYSGASAQIPYSINGSRTSANNWTVDGADNVDRGANLTLMTFPSPDAIDEFTVERTLYPADTGRAGGAQINVVTRGGSKQWHGSLFDFVRNDVLAANNWSNNANKVGLVDRTNPATACTTANYTDCYAKIPPIRWNDFGGNIGGPVPLGAWNKDHNKTFFFFQEEAHIIHTYTTFNPTLPTSAMLQGNFAQPVCITTASGVCPTGSAAVTNIPSSLWNSNAVAYIKDVFSKIPLDPSNPTAGFFPEENIFNSRQEIARIDQAFSAKFSLWGKFENDSIPTTEPTGLFNTGIIVPFIGTTHTNSPGQALVVHAVSSIQPTLLNEAMFTYSHSAIHIVPAGLMSKANSPDVNPSEPFANSQGVVPAVSFTGLSTFQAYGPYNEANRNWAGTDSVTWIKGRHTMKFGIVVDRYNKTENAANQEGTFGFTNAGAPPGTTNYYQSWANFLLGNVANFSMPSLDLTPNLWQWETEAYAQDQIRLSPRVTVSVGLRYSYFGQPSDANGRLLNFDPATYNPANAPQVNPATGTITSAGAGYATNGIIQGGKNSPFGAAVTNNSRLNFAPRFGIAWDPFGNGFTSVRAGYGIYYDSTEIGTFESPITGDPPNVQTVTYTNGSFSNIAGGTLGVPATPPVLALSADQLPAHIPYSQNWSFDIQRQIGKNMVLDVGYYGSKGTHLLGSIDLDQVPSGVALAAGLHQANGLTVFTSTDDPHINAIRPYLGFSAINAIETEFNSNYHSLQVHFAKRFTTNGLLDFSYTWSKTMNDSGGDSGLYPQSSYNIHEGEYAPYPGDRKHVVAMDYIYTVPFFAHSHGIANKALGGWELSGILDSYTGTPFTVTTSSVDPGGLGLLGSSGSSARPDLVCNANSTGPHQYNGHTGTGQPSWFNTACFQPVPQGVVRPGNADRGVVRGPGYFNLDASLIKNIGLTKENRLNLQLRGEAFNVLNWVNPGAFASTNNTVSSFGEISTFRAARRVQLAAKLIF